MAVGLVNGVGLKTGKQVLVGPRYKTVGLQVRLYVVGVGMSLAIVVERKKFSNYVAILRASTQKVGGRFEDTKSGTEFHFGQKGESMRDRRWSCDWVKIPSAVTSEKHPMRQEILNGKTKRIEFDIDPADPQVDVVDKTVGPADIPVVLRHRIDGLTDPTKHFMTIFELKDKLKTIDKGKNVNTKFEKSKTLGNKAKNVSHTKVPIDRSKPVTSQSTPNTKQIRKTIENACVNVVNDGSNIVCVSCGKDVLLHSHEKCVARYALTRNSSVKRALFTTPVAAKFKNLVATPVVAKSRLSVAKTPTTTNKVIQLILWIVDCRCSKHIKLLINFVEKFMGTICFGNDHFAAITGYGDYVQGNLTICLVYYVEGLGHNLFLVGQFCDGDLEVAFRLNICYVWNFEGDDLLPVHGIRIFTLFLFPRWRLLLLYA
ncbi:hypothetical protein Tco_0869172 [Tanacetum coccineum]